ncbi:hypothetical protein FOA43_003462 [Brettanomyces nanus]|uniref:Uncharacterized protein n=1 Tax=Eeniella nana TaxID=13502 RepID=A0A875S441_EENNA|nr:uncharacterized protein FOA43_003462 [Brettanomyces nanus]QPG76076.1 hypothetical protein FOA43_003462 [Brettanomyces nanus]
MKLKALWFKLESPFLNLTPRARLLQIGRFCSSLFVVISIYLLVSVPRSGNHYYMGRLDCSHVDVSNGIFASLQSSLNHPHNSNGDDTFTTTSEISILAQYIGKEVSTAAQFINTNILGWCSGTYSSVEMYNPATSTFELVSEDSANMRCSPLSANYVFDYRGQLSDIGLNIVLSYAYSSNDYSPEAKYVPDKQYRADLKERRQKNQAVIYMLLIAMAVHILIFVLGIIYYGRRGVKKNDKSLPALPKHIFGVAAIVAFLLMFVAFLIDVSVLEEIKKEIKGDLGDFGLSFHLNPAWISVFCIAMLLSFISIFVWGGPIWCAAAPINALDDDNVEEMLVHSYSPDAELCRSSDSEESILNPFADTVSEDYMDMSKNSPMEMTTLTDTDSLSSEDSSTRRVLCGQQTQSDLLLNSKRYRRPTLPPI